MEAPFFSIVIPTRNRAQTLIHSIETVLNQSYGNFELIVSDNSTDSDTETVMKAITDPRVKYFRTDGSLSMVDNWEVALKIVNGKYVLFIGDDDGLLVDALSNVQQIITARNSDVVFFNWIDYNWPDQTDPRLIGNRISIPIVKGTDEFIDTVKTLNDVVNAQSTYYALPSIYYSFVSKSLIDSIKSIDGRFFHSHNPDIFSGVIISLKSNKVFKTTSILGIRGTSSKANGAAFGFKNEQNKNLQNDFIKLNSLSKVSWHKSVPNIFNYYAIALESYLQSCELLDIRVSWHKMFLYYIKVIRRIYFDYKEDPLKVKEDLLTTKQVIESNYQINGLIRFILRKYISRLLKSNEQREMIQMERKAEIFGVGERAIILNGSNFGIGNIVDAQKLIKKILN